uniref:Uncharacterized protein n=1 Tax=Anguilla anguilla TaxID=7936 RepID=A0A0E9XX44_ANGAN
MPTATPLKRRGPPESPSQVSLRFSEAHSRLSVKPFP